MKTNVSHIYGALMLSKVNAFKLSKSERFKMFEQFTLSKVNVLGVSKS
jgi:hypothetical protein